MPLTVKTLPHRVELYYENPRETAFVYDSTTLYDKYVSNRLTPGSTSRVRPKKLSIGNGTAYTSSSRVSRDSAFETTYSTYPRRQYRNQLVDNPFYHKRSEPEHTPTISRAAMYNSIRNKLRHDATNLAQNMVEYRQTAKLFSDLAHVVASRGKALIKARPDLLRPRSGWKRGTSSAYLQYQYGVAPLCGDMASAMKEFRNRNIADPFYMSGKESRKEVREISDIMSDSFVASHQAKRTIHQKAVFVTNWEAQMNQNVILTALAAHGFTNPFAVAWEVIPFSFVIDWWVNVGDVLSSLDNLLLVDRLVVQDSSSVRTGYFVDTIPMAGSNVQSVGSSFNYYRTDSREGPNNISVINTINYKPSASFRHMANGLALLHQVLGKRR